MRLALFCLLACITEGGFAQSSARFSVARSVFAGGGATFSASSRFQLGSTIAQPLATVPSSPRFSIQGGFWNWPEFAIFAPIRVGTNFLLSFQTRLGKNYTPQYITALNSLNWQALPSVPGDGSVKTVTNSAPNAPQRFYRLVEQ